MKLPSFLGKFRDFLKTDVAQVTVLRYGNKYKRADSLEKIKIEGIILEDAQPKKGKTLSPRRINEGNIAITVPSGFTQLHSASFETALHILEQDGRDTLVFRGTPKITYSQAGLGGEKA
jgi:hypothetical protein